MNAVLCVGRVLESELGMQVFQAIHRRDGQHTLQQSTLKKKKITTFCSCPLLQFAVISFDFAPLHVKWVYHVIFLMP